MWSCIACVHREQPRLRDVEALPRFKYRYGHCNIHRRGRVHIQYELDAAIPSLWPVRNYVCDAHVRAVNIQPNVGIKESCPKVAWCRRNQDYRASCDIKSTKIVVERGSALPLPIKLPV